MSEVKRIPEDCPIRDILKQTAKVLDVLEKVLVHCEACLEKGGRDD